MKLSAKSKKASSLSRETLEPMYSVPPYSLGFPSKFAQSSYYVGDSASRDELTSVSDLMDSRSILPENTRVRKLTGDGTTHFQILQASIDHGNGEPEFLSSDVAKHFAIIRGDHKDQLRSICSSLSKASSYAANSRQQKFLAEYIHSFESGDLQAYRESQKTWVGDLSPKVENIFGFVEPYRDPLGVRAEFEGLVAISDPEETKALKELVENSSTFIRRLPWASAENEGKGPFEKALFEPPDFTSIHGKSTFRSFQVRKIDIFKLWHTAQASFSPESIYPT